MYGGHEWGIPEVRPTVRNRDVRWEGQGASRSLINIQCGAEDRAAASATVRHRRGNSLYTGLRVIMHLMYVYYKLTSKGK